MGGFSTLVASVLVHPVNFVSNVGEDIKRINKMKAEEAKAKQITADDLTDEERRQIAAMRRMGQGAK